ncbi:MAG: hypothetical protein ACLP0A_02105 [Verrucomicrobiia bacterium]
MVVTIIALFYAEEDLRGSRAWAQYRQQAEARGEQLDWKALIPKPVPDDQNFAATPFIASWFVRSNHASVFKSSRYWGKDDYGRAMDAVSSSQDKKDGGNRHFTDLAAWRMAFDAIHAGKLGRGQRIETSQLDLASRAKAAPAILEALKTNAAVFAELRVASQRPYSRYPINYDVSDPAEILLPHDNSIRAICRRLGLKACAELAVGQSDEALEDVKLSFSVADSVKGDPALISYLVRVACLHITTQAIWEGLAEHAWSESQLRELEAKLQSYDFVADLKPAFDAERSWGIGIIDYIKHSGKLAELNDSGSGDESAFDRLARIVPSGWFDREQVSYYRLFTSEMEGTFDPAARRVFPSRAKSSERVLDREFHGRNPFDVIFVRHELLSAMLLPALTRVSVKGATAQVATDQAALACALERYRLANGQFPEKLDALVPQVISKLPHDVITGGSYKYRRTNDGQFVLYSVGWNEKDDDGIPGKTLFDENEGDWVWQYPAQSTP